jgi:argininosuccinate lyase
MNHLSTISQDFIFMSSAGINVIELPAEYCTGSSIMPQKRNPDVLEAIKAKASILHGITSSIISIGKGNISGYNRDTQWTKYLVIDAILEFEDSPSILSGVIKRVKINERRSKQLLKKENAYAAEEAIKTSILGKKSFRQVKLSAEKDIKRL